MDQAELVLDGNAIAGLLGEIFVHEPTVARCVCGACGTVGELGGARVYLNAPGAVVRCVGCDAVLMVVVREGDRYVLGFERLRSLEIRRDPD